MIGFFIFAFAFVIALTLAVRFGGLRVRADLPDTKSVGLTLGFVGLVLLATNVPNKGTRLLTVIAALSQTMFASVSVPQNRAV
jgi:hypothetical protein